MNKIMPVELCNNIGKCMGHPSSYASRVKAGMFYQREPTKDRIAQHALQQLEAARAKDVEAHEKNLPAIENNKAIRAQVSQMMADIGMPSQWSERDTKSRSRYPKTVTHQAGWSADLVRECWISDSFEFATLTYERLRSAYQAYKREAEQEARKAEQAKQAEIDKRRADIELAQILVRYELDISSAWSDVLDALCEKDQRLNLAVAMQKTRGDWSDGPYRVTGAIRGFQVETDEDNEIVADILDCLHDFSDGRVFRDTAWSYSRLFAEAADQQLSNDIQIALGHETD